MRTVTAPHGEPDAARETERILLLAASTNAELVERLDALIAGDDVAAETAPGPRLGVVDPTPDRLAMARRIVAKGAPLRGRRDIWFSPEPLLATGGLAYVFPGLEADFDPRIEDVANLLGVSVPELSTSTVGRHAASVFAVGGLLGEALHALGVRPDAVAGHSAGEWQAMIAGGIVSRSDFDGMVARSDLDALRIPGVEFAVLGCAPERAAATIEHRDGMVVSHENSPNQTVVCGPSDVVATVMADLRGAGVLCQPLPFRSGFHTPMLRPYLGPFLTDGLPSLPMSPPSLPVWSATTARPFPDDPGAIRELSIRHLLEPVRFTALIRAMHDAGVRVFVQVGAGQLGSLIDDTLRGYPHMTIAANSAHRGGVAQLRRVATAVWVEGGSPDFTALEPGMGYSPPPEPTADDALPPKPAAGDPLSPPPGPDDPLSRLRALGATMPALDDLRQLLSETADAVADVVSAARHRQPNASPRPSAARQPPSVTPATPTVSVLDVSTTSMPYLLDHCLAAQRDDWPDETDRRPVLPATTMVAHMIDAALAAVPGHVVTEVRHVRLRRWLVAAPATRVDVTVRPADAAPDEAGHIALDVSLGDYADAELLVAPSCPSRDRAPGPWPPWPDERLPRLTARRLYDERWMFHGPAFRGITRSVAVAEQGMRGEITVPEPPGALLDNLGQLIGQWLVECHPRRCIAFPAEIASIRFHRPEPAPGTVVDAAIAVTDGRDAWVTVDGQIGTHDGVAISVTGWKDFRIEGDERVCAVHRFPERHTLATRHGGWWVVADEWPSVSTREFLLRKYLAAAERAEYDQLAPTERRRWLLARIAVKDAARGLLWDAGHGPLFPAELRVRQDTAGQFRAVMSRPGGSSTDAVDGQHIHVAQTHELTVAHHGPVAATEVVEGSLAVQQTVTAAEEALLDRLRAATSDPLPVALARLAAARAVASSRQEHKHSAALSDVDGPDLTLRTPHAEYRVRTDVIRNPDGLSARQYAVAALPAQASPSPATGGTR
ncbi:acyltransferase domain-containing protein [Haloechinothrix salitolerans]|uniref:Acyltransferase domain-containing protein n=1 Tax=Haloechinothrix salitolerans TaxID=926830 RepID=A0ABW2C7Y8_9PSEU